MATSRPGPMVRVAITVNDRQVLQILGNLPPALARGINLVLRETAFRAHAVAVRSLQSGQKTGRVYRRYNPRRVHRASAQGEAPASDSGLLVSSTNVVQAPSEAVYGLGVIQPWLVGVFGVPYGEILENRLDRPFITPAVESQSAFMNAKLDQLVAAITRNGGNALVTRGTP